MTRSEAKELQRLRDENTRLKRLLGQAELEGCVAVGGKLLSRVAAMMPSGISLGWAIPKDFPARSLAFLRSADRRARTRESTPDTWTCASGCTSSRVITAGGTARLEKRPRRGLWKNAARPSEESGVKKA